MITTLYIEQAVASHPVSQRIRARFPNATTVTIDRYGEVFNRKAQNFRLQKQRPALILARKFDNYVLPTPGGYGIGAQHNYYVSHMLNCVYDCRYCFLQGMYRSAHYVLFVNYEDFQQTMTTTIARHGGESVCFFSGYDCDSLALEPVSSYIDDLLPFFARHPDVWLEIRTKSTQIRTLQKNPALANVVVAFSFTPEQVATTLEHKVPGIERRLNAMQKLARQGWPLGLRFDPLIYTEDFEQCYRQLFRHVFTVLQADKLHSVSFGPFRLPGAYFRNLQRLYPDEVLFANEFERRNGVISYHRTLEQQMRDFCTRELSRYIGPEQMFPCEF